MTTNVLLTVFKKLDQAAQEADTKIVIMGGIAVSIYALPRTTLDIDGVIDVEESSTPRFLEAAAKQGFQWDRKNPLKSIKELPFITLLHPSTGVYIDLFLAQNDFQRSAISRSRTVKVSDIQFEVMSPEDLILVKLISDRPRDTEDVRGILVENADNLDYAYLNRWSNYLGISAFLRDELRSTEAGKQKNE